MDDQQREVSIELIDFLSSIREKHQNEHVLYYPNRGNAGDALIYASEMQLFSRLNIKVDIVTDPTSAVISKRTILYAGGGNLNNLYPDCADFLKKYDKPELENIIILLPHSIFGREQLLASLSSRVTILCREQQTFSHVIKYFPFKQNVFLSHDAAFYLEVDKLLEQRSKVKETRWLTCMRTDAEKTGAPYDPAANVDVSRIFPDERFLHGPKRIGCAKDFLNYIDKYTHVKTNRLHVCIAAALLGKTVEFYGNSYFKNEAVFNHSFSHFHLDSRVKFRHYNT